MYAKYRAQGQKPTDAFKSAGYESAPVNAYRLENRSDIQAQIKLFQDQRKELLAGAEQTHVNAGSLQELGLTKTFLVQSLLSLLSTAQGTGDVKGGLATVKMITDLLNVRFDTHAVEDMPDMTPTEIMAKLEALTK
jgi:hypothetical protein